MGLTLNMKQLTISVCLHILVLGLLYLNKNTSTQVTESEIVQLDLIEIKPNKHERAIKRKKGKVVKGKLSIASLTPSTVGALADYSKTHTYNEGGASLDVPDNPGAPWGEGGTQFQRISSYRHYEQVAHTMKFIIEYPMTLAHKKIGGIVRARLVVNDKRVCNWHLSFIEGNHPYLRFYVLTKLKQLCKTSFWHKLKLRKSSNIDFNINFNTFAKGEPTMFVNGNVVLFDLPGNQDKGNWKLGPIQGHILQPNMIFADPIWIVENWNRLMYDKDPLARFKEELESETNSSEY